MFDWKTASRAGKLKIITFSLVPVMILGAIAQFLAFMTIHRTVNIWTDEFTGQRYYAMRLGAWPWSHVGVTPLNSLGLPDDEYVNVLPKGNCTHVIIAGDSFVFGDATARYLSFFQQLKGISQRRFPHACVRFFNVSERNSTIDKTAGWLRTTLPLIQPDIVILGQYQNDLSDLTNPGSPAWVPDTAHGRDNQWGEVLRRTIPGYDIALVRWVTYRLFALAGERGTRWDVLRRWSVLADESRQEEAERLKAIYRQLYDSLVTDLRGRSIDVAVVIIPSKMDLVAHRYPEGEFFVGLAREFQVPYFELMPVLDAHRRPFPYYLYDGHLNERGNAIVADAVADWLFDSEPAPLPGLQRVVASRGGARSGAGVRP